MAACPHRCNHPSLFVFESGFIIRFLCWMPWLKTPCSFRHPFLNYQRFRAALFKASDMAKSPEYCPRCRSVLKRSQWNVSCLCPLHNRNKILHTPGHMKTMNACKTKMESFSHCFLQTASRANMTVGTPAQQKRFSRLASLLSLTLFFCRMHPMCHILLER